MEQLIESQSQKKRQPVLRLPAVVKENIAPAEDVEIIILKNIIRDGDLEGATKRLMEMIVSPRFRQYWVDYSDDAAIRIWKYVRHIKIVPADFIWGGEPMLTAMVYLLDGTMFINAGFFLAHVNTGGDLLWLMMHERDHLVLSKLFGLGRWGYSPLGLRKAKLWAGLMNLGEDAYINAKLRNRIKSTMVERFFLTMSDKEMSLTTGFSTTVKKTRFDKVQRLHHRLQNSDLLDMLGQPQCTLTATEHKKVKEHGSGAADIDYTTWMDAWKKEVAKFLAQEAKDDREEEERQQAQQAQGEGEGQGGQGQGQQGDQGDDQGQGQGQGQGDDQGQGQQGDDQGQGQGDDQGDKGADQSQPGSQGPTGQQQGSRGAGKTMGQDAQGSKRLKAEDLIRQAMQGNHDGTLPITHNSEDAQAASKARDGSTKKKFGDLDDKAIILILDTEPPNTELRNAFPDLREDLQIPLDVLNHTLGDFVSKHISEGDAVTGYSMSIPGQVSQRDLRELAMGNTPVMWEQSIGSEPEPVDVYMDISGSMARYIPLVPHIVEALHRHIRKVYHFATLLEEVAPLTDEYGGVGGGTEFRNVHDQILENPPGHVIIFSDDEDSLTEEEMNAVKDHSISIIFLRVANTRGPWAQIADEVVRIDHPV